MPFTFSHPAMILPLRSKAFNFSGLILGAMAPDFIYFVLFSPISNLGHTFLGVILFNLPMCLLLNYLFYKYIQEFFLCTLPDVIAVRYLYMTKNKNILRNKTDYLRFTYSCFIGMCTHIFWDAFTHKTGFFVEKIRLLSEDIMILNINVPIYKVLQHGSTFIGFTIICIYIYVKRDTVIKTYCFKINKKRIWLGIISITLVSTVLFLNIFLRIKGFVGIGRIVVTFINSIFFSYLILGLVHYSKLKNNRCWKCDEGGNK